MLVIAGIAFTIFMLGFCCGKESEQDKEKARNKKEEWIKSIVIKTMKEKAE
ncbi:hypothetical protein MM182_18900 [Aeromonas sp. MR19]|uniref:hypothetical protein n=1 Tax=Aeromonas sp. MR19 TaxID=2923421 RepID=UPI001F4A7083|nr:hypothetical protein [Aeromonas sp. MR19]MCH7377424.1 hypothetical protein [Aeromonas sp. MR19]